MSIISVGSAVTLVDQQGNIRDALITRCWGDMSNLEELPCVNLVSVAIDSDKKDPFGSQIERFSSVPPERFQTAHGFYWKVK